MIQGLGFWGAKGDPQVNYIFSVNSAHVNNYMKIIINSVTYLDTTNQSSQTGVIPIPVYPVCQVGVRRESSTTSSLTLLIRDETTGTILESQTLTGGTLGGTWGWSSVANHIYLVQVIIS